MAKLAAFRQRVELRANGMVGDAFRKHHAQVARKALAQVQAAQAAKYGQPAPVERFVDGRPGAREDAVRLYGVIEYQFSLAADVAGQIYEMILRASPVGPAEGGHYRDDHIILVNGEQVADLRDIRAGDEIAITNLRPYARKIEGGAKERFRRRLTNRRPGLSIQAPNGVYEITAHAARQRFGNMVAIEFTYRASTAGGAAIAPSQATVLAPVRRTAGGQFAKGSGRALIGGEANKGNVRYPTIIIRPR